MRGISDTEQLVAALRRGRREAYAEAMSRYINSQGVYESWYSALPSYVMLRAACRFEIFPHKR